MNQNFLADLPQTEFDAEAAYAAIDELPPRCRAAFILFMWDQYNAEQIVDYMESKGVAMDTATVKRLLTHAFRHFLQRQAEAAQRKKSMMAKANA